MDYTIKDVAQKADVSITTVSRVLNNKPDVSEKTKEKIRGYLCANLDKITREIQIKKLTFLSENKTTHFINYELLRYKPLN